jgi:hypothetical protein
MTKRDLGAAFLGACIALIVALALLAGDRGLTTPALAQANPVAEHQRLLLLALADAIASVAVDGERAALAVNEATDQIKSLQGRMKDLEKRLTELDKRR